MGETDEFNATKTHVTNNISQLNGIRKQNAWERRRFERRAYSGLIYPNKVSEIRIREANPIPEGAQQRTNT